MDRYLRALLLCVAVLVCTALDAAAASGSDTAQTQPSSTQMIVESFLGARNAGDSAGAAEWVASVLALQDVDGQWFIDAATTSNWLRQLTDRYVVETVTPVLAEGETATWTERLSPRSTLAAGVWAKAMTLEVHAVIQDGKVASLSAAYPPLPLRTPSASAGSWSPVGKPTVEPGTLFVGTALGMAATALLVARGGPAVIAALQRTRH